MKRKPGRPKKGARVTTSAPEGQQNDDSDDQTLRQMREDRRRERRPEGSAESGERQEEESLEDRNRREFLQAKEDEYQRWLLETGRSGGSAVSQNPTSGVAVSQVPASGVATSRVQASAMVPTSGVPLQPSSVPISHVLDPPRQQTVPQRVFIDVEDNARPSRQMVSSTMVPPSFPQGFGQRPGMHATAYGLGYQSYGSGHQHPGLTSAGYYGDPYSHPGSAGY